MTRSDLAKRLNIDIKTLSNWEKTKPELIKLINLGLSTEKQILNSKNFLKEMKDLQNKTEIDKSILKSCSIEIE